MVARTMVNRQNTARKSMMLRLRVRPGLASTAICVLTKTLSFLVRVLPGVFLRARRAYITQALLACGERMIRGLASCAAHPGRVALQPPTPSPEGNGTLGAGPSSR